MTPDGNSDAEEERASTGIGKYLYKCERLYLYIFSVIILISLKDKWIFKVNIIHFIKAQKAVKEE